MFKAIAKGEQFFTRTANESTKGSRKGFSLLGGGEDVFSHLSPEERRASLVQKVNVLHAEIKEVKKGKDKKRLLELGKAISETSMAIHACRPKRTSSSEVVDFFIDVCRETMTKPQFKAIMDEANRRLRAKQEAK